MRYRLSPHPDSHCIAVRELAVELQSTCPGRLTLTYLVSGTTASLRLPSLSKPARTDGLWRHTCFEAFLAAPAGETYDEFNFSPSTAWAAYHFSGYRQGMREAAIDSAPQISLSLSEDHLDLCVHLHLPIDGPRRLGLSAVIEEVGGGISYWALTHSPGKPDFHHPDTFIGALAPQDTP